MSLQDIHFRMVQADETIASIAEADETRTRCALEVLAEFMSVTAKALEDHIEAAEKAAPTVANKTVRRSRKVRAAK